MSHIFKNVSKGQEAADKRVKVNGHSRSAPKRTTAGGSTGVKAPDHQPNPAMVQPVKHKKLDETRPGAATVASRAKSGAKNAATSVAKSGSAEAGKHGSTSSTANAKLEDRTLKGLKGPKSKILREGHNTSASIPTRPAGRRIDAPAMQSRRLGGTSPIPTRGSGRRDKPVY